MKKILTALLFVTAFGLSASAQEATTAVAATATPAKPMCCAADAKKATAEAKTASCHSETATASATEAKTNTALAANTEASASVQPAAPAEKKGCKTSGACCGDAKAEAKKVL